MADDREILYKIEQNPTNFMYITKSYFKDKEYYDIRKYFINEKGQEIATKKGLMLNAEEWEKVCTLMLDFIKVIDKEQNNNETKADDFISNQPDTSGFDYKSLDDITLSDGNPFGDGEFPF
jgi:hypothetical protein